MIHAKNICTTRSKISVCPPPAGARAVVRWRAAVPVAACWCWAAAGRHGGRRGRGGARRRGRGRGRGCALAEPHGGRELPVRGRQVPAHARGDGPLQAEVRRIVRARTRVRGRAVVPPLAVS